MLGKLFQIVIVLTCVTSVCGSAEAKAKKYYYLRMGSSVQAYKTKAACEAVMRSIIALDKKYEKQTGIKQAFKPRCLDTLPYDYEMPRG